MRRSIWDSFWQSFSRRAQDFFDPSYKERLIELSLKEHEKTKKINR